MDISIERTEFKTLKSVKVYLLQLLIGSEFGFVLLFGTENVTESNAIRKRTIDIFIYTMSGYVYRKSLESLAPSPGKWVYIFCYIPSGKL